VPRPAPPGSARAKEALRGRRRCAGRRPRRVGGGQPRPHGQGERGPPEENHQQEDGRHPQTEHPERLGRIVAPMILTGSSPVSAGTARPVLPPDELHPAAEMIEGADGQEDEHQVAGCAGGPQRDQLTTTPASAVPATAPTSCRAGRGPPLPGGCRGASHPAKRSPPGEVDDPHGVVDRRRSRGHQALGRPRGQACEDELEQILHENLLQKFPSPLPLPARAGRGVTQERG